MNFNFISFVALIFLALTLFAVGILRFWSAHWGDDAMTIKRRLRSIMGNLQLDTKSLMKTRLLSRSTIINSVLERIPYISLFDVFLSQAGMQLNVSSFLTWIFLLEFSLLIVIALTHLHWIFNLTIMLVPATLCFLYLQRKRIQRVLRIEAQLPDTLDLMARAMQAGHAFSSALLIVGTEGLQPIRGEFQTTFDEINFGIPTETALHHLTQRVASSDLKFFVVAVLIQLETGGNLTDILKSLAALIRDRQRIAGTVRVLTAEGRLSAWILGLLPFVIAAMLSVLNHDFISKLWTNPLGIRMLEVSLALMILGIWWMWQMVRVKV